MDLRSAAALRWLLLAWRQLTSMRTALFLLMLLAVAAVPGSVFPQRGVDATRVREFREDHPTAGPWLDRLGMFDVYASVWFSAIYLLLFISLIGCVAPRTGTLLRSLTSPPPRTPTRLSRMPAYRRVVVAEPADQVVARASAMLTKRRYRVAQYSGSASASSALASSASAQSAQSVSAQSVSAERGYLREAGNLVFHVALMGLLVAVAAGGLYGYRGTVVVPVGQGFANVLAQWDTQDLGVSVDPDDLPPFQFVLEDLAVRFETDVPPGSAQFAAPRDFAASVTVRDAPAAAPRREIIKVNDPLSVRGVNVYLAGNGYAPLLTVRDSSGQVVKSGPVIFRAQDAFYLSTGVVKAPDGDPQVGLDGLFAPSADTDADGPLSRFPDLINPRLYFTAYTGDLGLDDGVPQSAYSLDTTDLTQLEEDGKPFVAELAPGDSVDLPDQAGSVRMEGVVRFAAFQLRHDPAKGWALGFASAAMIGLVVSLFVPRRRIWVRGIDQGIDTVVEVAGLARSEDPRLVAEVQSVLDRLALECSTQEQSASKPEPAATKG